MEFHAGGDGIPLGLLSLVRKILKFSKQPKMSPLERSYLVQLPIISRSLLVDNSESRSKNNSVNQDRDEHFRWKLFPVYPPADAQIS